MVRSFSDILRRLAGGGPSLSDAAADADLDSMPSGTGEPLCEVCCEAGGEGYGPELRRDEKRISGGGLGDELNSVRGDDGTLLSGEESALSSADEASMASMASASGKVQSGGCRRGGKVRVGAGAGVVIAQLAWSSIVQWRGRRWHA